VKYQLHAGAAAEHLGRVRYYEAQRRGLGARYLKDFEQTMARICESPARHKLKRPPSTRAVSFRSFPCSVIYREVSGFVQVLAVSHHRQQPGYWIARL